MPVPISIIICTRNRANHLRKTLATVARLRTPGWAAPELVVVDNASTDKTPAVVRAIELPNMPVRLIKQLRPGVSGARNTAVRAANGKILLVTDDDTRLPENWIIVLCEPIRLGTADAVVGKVVIPPHLKRTWMQPFHRAILSSTECMNEQDPQDMFGASMAFSRRVLEKVPGFDPELGPGTAIGALEDTLFAWQLRAAGYRMAFASEAVVEHHFDRSRLLRSSFLSAARRHGQARAYMAYHWQHVPYAISKKAPSPWLTLAVRRTRLAAFRQLRRTAREGSEGITQREFTLVRQVQGVRQYLKERKRPPNYDRRGLVKRTSGEILN